MSDSFFPAILRFHWKLFITLLLLFFQPCWHSNKIFFFSHVGMPLRAIYRFTFTIFSSHVGIPIKSFFSAMLGCHWELFISLPLLFFSAMLGFNWELFERQDCHGYWNCRRNYRSWGIFYSSFFIIIVKHLFKKGKLW